MLRMARSLTVLTLAAMLLATGCQRSVRVADDKGRYSNQNVKSLGGKHGESRQVNSEEEFGWSYDQEAYSSQNALDAQNSQCDQYLNPGENGLPAYAQFRTPNEQESRIFEKVYFETNDDVIRGKKNFEKIEEMSRYMKNNPRTLIFVEGHCDERGASAYNLTLGSRRANSVRNLLIEQGIEASRIFTITFGEERPAVSGHDESAWKFNRRTEYKLYQR
jgi:peptidoglycan-associated lipoprotein